MTVNAVPARTHGPAPMIIDHLVSMTMDIDARRDFRTRVLGMRMEIFGEGRAAFRF